jgi:sigma-E factor negative regulatory protein RseB
VTARRVVPLLLVLGLGTCVVLGVLVWLGAPSVPTSPDGYEGWTGRIDPSTTSDLAAMTPDDDIAVALLARSARAASTLAYTGRAVSRSRTGSAATDVVHLPGRGTVVTPVAPKVLAATLAPDGRSGSFADDGSALDLLRIHYRVLRQADLDATVAGRATDAVVAVDSDGVLAARYWLDHATGLLMRKELLDPSGRVRRTTEFTSFTLSVPASLSLPATSTDPWSAPLSTAALAAHRSAGCACPESLPGGLTMIDSREAPAGVFGETAVVHQLFSDGVTTVSLFSLPGTIDAENADGLRAKGFRPYEDGRAWIRGGTADAGSTTVVWSCRGSVLTLVTDDSPDPATTAHTVLEAFPPDASDSSLWARVARGWHRITGGDS